MWNLSLLSDQSKGKITNTLDHASGGERSKFENENKHKLRLLGCEGKTRACLKHVSFRGTSNWLRVVFVDFFFSPSTCLQLSIAFDFKPKMLIEMETKSVKKMTKASPSASFTFSTPATDDKKLLKTIVDKLDLEMEAWKI